MAKYRDRLPQLSGDFFMTDGGIETTLIWREGQDLPHFAAFHLLRTAEGESALEKYFRTYAELARRSRIGVILETATWRANRDWGERLGYGREALATANERAVSLVEGLRSEYESPETAIVISGCIGPRADGYDAAGAMAQSEAEDYHRAQIATFSGSAADLVTAMTMSYAAEAVGIVRAARQAAMPVVISLTVETDGRLPSGQSLEDAVSQIDGETAGYAAYFMVNCAHPSHFAGVLREGGPWLERIHGLRANASPRSHAEMDEAPDMDAGDPVEFGREYAELKRRLRHLNVMGGCCGTDDRHIEQIVSACLPLFGKTA